MARWIYAQNNAYDLVGKIVDDKVYIFTQDKFFPNLVGLDEDERNDVIEKFMADVIESDYSETWDEYYIEELEGNDILWEKEIPADINEIRELSGLSGVKFAEKYGIPYRTYMDWVHGRTTPPSYMMEWLERLVRIDFTQEITQDNQKPTENCG